ncbi:hypothetical protein ACE6H2_016297 [Prunus campanulata]
MAAAEKMRESSVQVKGSSTTSTANPEVHKSNPAGDASVFDPLKMNLLSSMSACFKLVDHIHQAGDLDTVLSLSLEKQREVPFHLLQRGVVFAIETI